MCSNGVPIGAIRDAAVSKPFIRREADRGFESLPRYSSSSRPATTSSSTPSAAAPHSIPQTTRTLRGCRRRWPPSNGDGRRPNPDRLGRSRPASKRWRDLYRGRAAVERELAGSRTRSGLRPFASVALNALRFTLTSRCSPASRWRLPEREFRSRRRPARFTHEAGPATGLRSPKKLLALRAGRVGGMRASGQTLAARPVK
jgi:hypothetical protein